jgi:hypothetical protein
MQLVALMPPFVIAASISRMTAAASSRFAVILVVVEVHGHFPRLDEVHRLGEFLKSRRFPALASLPVS